MVLRALEALDLHRAESLNFDSIAQFYQNLEELYLLHNYKSWQIWNCDESSAQANNDRERVVLARRGTRSIHTIVFLDKEWLLVLVVVNFVRGTMPNYYVFKEKRPK